DVTILHRFVYALIPCYYSDPIYLDILHIMLNLMNQDPLSMMDKKHDYNSKKSTNYPLVPQRQAHKAEVFLQKRDRDIHVEGEEGDATNRALCEGADDRQYLITANNIFVFQYIVYTFSIYFSIWSLLIATASTKGTLVRIYNAAEGNLLCIVYMYYDAIKCLTILDRLE
ncbi:hypothetical protein ACJX0J_022766, partial [Zea mays]